MKSDSCLSYSDNRAYGMGIDQTRTEKLMSSQLHDLNGIVCPIQDETVRGSSILDLARIDVSLYPSDDTIRRYADESVDGVFELVQRERVHDRAMVERGRCVHVGICEDRKKGWVVASRYISGQEE
jgi:hypothetical protein